jgi:hypothetical protein
MDGAENTDFLLASTSSKPAQAANGKIMPHEEQDKMDEPLQTRRKSSVHVPDMSLDDLEPDDEDGQDLVRQPQRKIPQDSMPTLNNSNVAEESNEPGKSNSAVECTAAHHNFVCHSTLFLPMDFIPPESRQLPDLFLPSRAWNASVPSL